MANDSDEMATSTRKQAISLSFPTDCELFRGGHLFLSESLVPSKLRETEQTVNKC